MKNFFPWLIAQKKNLSRLSGGLKKMLMATLAMLFQAVQGVMEWAVLVRPANLHKPTRKRPEQAGVSTPEYAYQPERNAFTYCRVHGCWKSRQPPSCLTLGYTHNWGVLFAGCHPPNLSLRRLATSSAAHWILTEEQFILWIAALGDGRIK